VAPEALSSAQSAPAEANPDVNLDIGQRLRVDSWDADGTAQVMYRGASWTTVYRGSATPEPGEHTIVAVQGSRLVVSPVVPH
jgi:membrane protein implicated in regulation of membrane protease activity